MIDTQILTQLVVVEHENGDRVAFPLEEVTILPGPPARKEPPEGQEKERDKGRGPGRGSGRDKEKEKTRGPRRDKTSGPRGRRRGGNRRKKDT